MLMGFPVGCSEVPTILLHLLFLLGHLRRLSSWLLRLAGLAGADSNWWAASDADHPRHYHHYSLDEHSPAVRFDSLMPCASSSDDHPPQPLPLPDGCCVCLGDFHGAAEVRRARGCRHVFHRGCLDRWAAHGNRTCPLCRTPFLPPSPSPSLSLWIAACDLDQVHGGGPERW